MSKLKTKQYATYDSFAPKEIPNETQEIKSDLDIISLDHRKSLLEQNNVVCIYLWSTFCHPCKILAPKYSELAKQYYKRGKCILMKENLDTKFTTEYQATAVPAFIFYKNGNIVRQADGKIVDVIGGDFNKVISILNKLQD